MLQHCAPNGKPDPTPLPLILCLVYLITSTVESGCNRLTQLVFTQALALPQHKQKLEGLGLDSTGKKAELLDRLNPHHAQVRKGTSIAACSLLANSQPGRCMHVRYLDSSPV